MSDTRTPVTVEDPDLRVLWADVSADAVAFDRDGDRLLVTAEGSVVLWEVATERLVWAERLREGAEATDVASSPDGTRFAVACDDGVVRVLDAATGERVLGVEHADVVTSVAFAPQVGWLASGSDDGTAWVSDPTSGRKLAEVEHEYEVTAVALSPDGSLLATAAGDEVARLWDTANGRLVATFRHAKPVSAVAFAPDGSRLATASWDWTARVWDVTSGDQLVEVAHARAVNDVVFTADGARFATVSDDRTARLWDAATGQPLVLAGHGDAIDAVAISPDGRHLVTAGWGVRLWTLDPDAPDGPVLLGHWRPPSLGWRLVGCLLALVLAGALVWVIAGSAAPLADRAWWGAGILAVAFGVTSATIERRDSTSSPHHRATCHARERAGAEEGWRCDAVVELGDGTTVTLPIHARNRRPGRRLVVALLDGDRHLEVGEDPHRADAAVIVHPIEQYGWAAAALGFAVVACTIALWQ